MSQEYYDILVAEDDEQISYLLNFLLTREGFTVKVANDGQEAMDAIGQISQPKLVLLDIMMPHYNGYQIIDHIRHNSNWKKVPILVVTAKSLEKDIVKALEIGANDYVVKPFQPRELIGRLKALLQRAA
ncbi:MAG TPA: response regulator transcription factor [Gammaproteobacteria bacterium]|nr:response regulator transcription factor [Gammaproteobacteria bacterium]